LSQEQLAEKAGLNRTYVGSLERGERNIALRNLCRLATALRLSVSDMIAEAEGTGGRT
jgi:transcriptional regulator with XRE-family HTH domain